MRNELGAAPPDQSGRRFLSWPSSRAGRWSAVLLLAFMLFIGLFYLLVASGQRGGDTFFANPWLALTILPAAFSAAAGGAAAAVALFRQQERSIISFIALMLGLFVVIFVTGEIVSPH